VQGRAAVSGQHRRPRRAAVLRRRPAPLDPVLRGAGVNLDIHQPRHAHATELTNAEVSIDAVRRRLGYASTETTQLYTLLDDKVADDEIRAARRRHGLQLKSRLLRSNVDGDGSLPHLFGVAANVVNMAAT
jgi:hypothetical protein